MSPIKTEGIELNFLTKPLFSNSQQIEKTTNTVLRGTKWRVPFFSPCLQQILDLLYTQYIFTIIIWCLFDVNIRYTVRLPFPKTLMLINRYSV